MIRSMMSHGTFGLLLLSLALTPARAQIESGRVIDDSTLAPLAGSRVILERGVADAWTGVDTARTDARGFFQFAPRPPGVYRVALLGKSEPMFLGAADTLAADSMQQREFPLPITRRGVAQAYLASEVEQPARTLDSPSVFPIDPSEARSLGRSDDVTTQFVVSADGSVDLATIRVLTATNPTFAESIRRTLTSARYHPATIGGVPVRQLVERKDRIQTRVEIRHVR